MRSGSPPKEKAVGEVGGVRGSRRWKTGKSRRGNGGRKKNGWKKEASRKDWQGEGRRAVRKQKGGEEGTEVRREAREASKRLNEVNSRQFFSQWPLKVQQPKKPIKAIKK